MIKFQKYYNEDEDVLLFINFESSTIENENGTTNDFIPIIEKYNIRTKNIVIEIKEDKIKNEEALKNFINNYKKQGCTIAIDDFGTGYSSFDRLSFIKPSIVKVDHSIIHNIHNNFINSEILSAISNMCNRIGAVVLAEGVEHREEVLSCLKKDIDIFQGFWFCKPKKSIDPSIVIDIEESIEYIGTKYKTMVTQQITNKQILLEKGQKILEEVVSKLEDGNIENTNILDEVLGKYNNLQAVYILFEKTGIQIGQTIIHAEEKTLFKATNSGHNHSLREYYYIAKDALRGDYLSTKYISKASGSLCRTYSAKVSIEGENYIFCFDILA